MGLISILCICAMSLYAMRTQATYKLYNAVLPFVRKNADAVHTSLEAARSASAASEAWEHSPGLGAALTAANALQVLKGALCCCCSAQCFHNQHLQQSPDLSIILLH